MINQVSLSSLRSVYFTKRMVTLTRIAKKTGILKKPENYLV